MILKKSFKKLQPTLVAYEKCKQWIHSNTVPEQGIRVQVGRKNHLYPAYPEVTGYFIPSLLNWGERNLALQYANWLIKIQKPDGSWHDYEDKHPYTFDTGQILKGLLAIEKTNLLPEAKASIVSGCNWLISNIQSSGQLTTPSEEFWDLSTLTDIIHLYCLHPLKEAGERFQRTNYTESAKKVLNYYMENQKDKILNFHTLSHFYAYILEGLLDIGEQKIVEKAMKNMAKIQNKNGSLPAYANVNWVCLPGLMQMGVIWYKLGNIKEGDAVFNYVLKKQNKSGGFLGSVGMKAKYLPKEEPSWACKYFLDLLYYKTQAHLRIPENYKKIITTEALDKSDGRINVSFSAIKDSACSNLIDMGCGTGRITHAIKNNFPQIQAEGLDINQKALSCISKNIPTHLGTLLENDLKDNSFEFALYVESLEHAVDINNALNEAYRILKVGGTLLIIDKNINSKTRFKLQPWEQWFDPKKLAESLSNKKFTAITVEYNLPYDGRSGKDGLFFALKARKSSL